MYRAGYVLEPSPLPSFFMMLRPISAYIYGLSKALHSPLQIITGPHACASRYQRLSVVGGTKHRHPVIEMFMSLTAIDSASWPPPFRISKSPSTVLSMSFSGLRLRPHTSRLL